MKSMRIFRSESGSTLLMSLLFLSLISLGGAALVKASQRQTILAARSRAWQKTLPIADAGIAEALSHLNDSPAMETNNWTAVGSSGWRKSRSFGDGVYTVTILDSDPPRIRSRGEVPSDDTSTPTTRTILVQTRRSESARIEVAGAVQCSSSGVIDAYDSSDPVYSTGGLYDPLKRKDTAVMASASGPVDLGSRLLYGRVDQGNSGEVRIASGGKVGDADWIARSDTAGQIQPGHIRNDYNGDFAPAKPPFTNGLPPLSTTVGSTLYKYVFMSGDYRVNGFNLMGSEKGIVLGNARIYVTSGFTISGSAELQVAPGATVQIYCDCTTVTISGGGVVNQSQRPRNVSILGTESVTRADISGVSSFYGRIIVPKARLTLSGGSSLYGALKANSLIISGSNQLHVDEALKSGHYIVASWREL